MADNARRPEGEPACMPVAVEDVATVVAWWRASNESPGGCGPRKALDGMGDAIFRLYERLQAEGHNL